LNPSEYGVIKDTEEIGTFANNDISFKDETGIDHEMFSFGLKKSLYNFMHGIGFEIPVNQWFDTKLPRTKIPSDYIEKAVNEEEFVFHAASSKVVWLGGQPQISYFTKTKKGTSYELANLLFEGNSSSIEIQVSKEEGDWLAEILPLLSKNQSKKMSFKEVEEHYYTMNSEDFEPFWYGKALADLKEIGLLVV
jgi:hypothetical protein